MWPFKSLKSDLRKAAIEGDLGKVERLIASGSSVNAKDSEAISVLRYANRHPEVVRFLIENGAAINAKSKDGITVLMDTVTVAPHPEVVELLIKNGADVNAESRRGGTALSSAIWGKHSEIVYYLLKNGAHVRAKDVESLSMLMIHTSEFDGNWEFVNEFIDHGAKVNAQDNNSKTALERACSANRLEIVRLLIDRGANVRAYGGEALESACYGYNATISLPEGCTIGNSRTGVFRKDDFLDRYANIVALLLKKGASAEGSTMQKAKEICAAHRIPL
jgi:ankyrin repeat protein